MKGWKVVGPSGILSSAHRADKIGVKDGLVLLSVEEVYSNDSTGKSEMFHVEHLTGILHLTPGQSIVLMNEKEAAEHEARIKLPHASI